MISSECVRFCVDFRGEAATRPPERLPFLPPCSSGRNMRTHDGGVEHLKEMRRGTPWTHLERVEERLEDASLA